MTATPLHQVEIRFVGKPPVTRMQRAAGVSRIETDGSIARCAVAGSFQPFLEALRGHEVITVQSVPAVRQKPATHPEGARP